MVFIYPECSLLIHRLLTVKTGKVGFSIKKKKSSQETCILVAEM